MSFNSDASSPAAESADKPPRTPHWASAISKPKWLLVLYATVCPLLGAYFFYFEDDVSFWFLSSGLFCLVPLSGFALSALFRRRWRAVAIFAAAIVWTLSLSPALRPDEPLKWLRVVGFRVHAFPMDRYLAQCQLQEFVDGGKVQKLGPCDGIEGYPNLTSHVLFYDPSRQLDRPLSERTDAWKQAMLRATEQRVMPGRVVRTVHLFGDFYEIDISF
jgi:hypothetical protein